MGLTRCYKKEGFYIYSSKSVEIDLLTKFRWDNSICGWDITTSSFDPRSMRFHLSLPNFVQINFPIWHFHFCFCNMVIWFALE